MIKQTLTITVSQKTFRKVSAQAKALRQPVESYIDQLLQINLELPIHPYIVQKEGVRGGLPILRDTRMPVWLIITMWKKGDSIEEILIAYPHLKPAAVYDAISYYLDHQADIEQQIAANQLDAVLQRHQATIDNTGLITFPSN